MPSPSLPPCFFCLELLHKSLTYPISLLRCIAPSHGDTMAIRNSDCPCVFTCSSSLRNCKIFYFFVGCFESCAQSCLTLCYLLDCSLPGSSVHGVFQVRVLKWVAMPSSRGSSWPKNRTLVSCVSCTAGGFFTCWAIREALLTLLFLLETTSCVFSTFSHTYNLE